MKKKAIVLVHGAWVDGSSWNKIIPLLLQAGHTVVGTQHCLSSLEEDVETLRQLEEAQNGDTILVGHSYGGVIITEAAYRCPNVKALVYIAAFAPDEGESMDSLSKAFASPPSIAALRPDTYGRLWLERETFGENFCQDVDPAEAAVLSAIQKPIAIRCFMDTVTHAGWKMVPSWYQVSQNDHMIQPALQEAMAKGIAPKEVLRLPASHAAMLSHYNEVANFILQACNAT